MARVTLLRLPSVVSRSSQTIPTTLPLGLVYLGAALREAGHEVQFIDGLAEDFGNMGPTGHPMFIYQGLSIEGIVSRIDPASQAVGISCMYTLSWPHTRDIIAAIHARYPRLPIILGGEHSTSAWRESLDDSPGVFAIALGEGEETLCEFADWVDGKRELAGIAGLAHRGLADPSVVPPRARIRDIDSLPWPAWDMIPLETYLGNGLGFGVDRGRSLAVLATRGCPYQCTFCSSPGMWTTRYVVRKPALVVDEIEHNLRRWGATNVDFMDLTAIIRREWILEFCAELKRRGLAITFQLPTGTRSEALDGEVLRALYASGCRNITYAPESGSEVTLKAIKKKLTLAKLKASYREAVKAGLTVKCNLVIGFPHETRADVLRTLAFSWRAALDGVTDCLTMLFTPYPGSELYRELKAKGRIGRLDDDYVGSLASFLDLTLTSPYCERIGPRELNLYRILSIAGFYALSYLSHPSRFPRSLRNLWSGRSESAVEQRLLDMMKRRRLAAGRAAAPSPAPLASPAARTPVSA